MYSQDISREQNKCSPVVAAVYFIINYIYVYLQDSQTRYKQTTEDTNRTNVCIHKDKHLDEKKNPNHWHNGPKNILSTYTRGSILEVKCCRLLSLLQDTAAILKGILAKNNGGRQTSSEVKLGRVGLVLGWVPPSNRSRVVLQVLFSKSIFFSHYHSFSLVLKHTKSVHLRNFILFQTRACS